MKGRIVAAFAASALVVATKTASAQEPSPEIPPLPPPSSSPPQGPPPPPPSSPPPPPSTVPPTPPPSAPLPHGRPHVDDSGFVTLTIEADAPGVHLQALTEHEGFFRVYGRWHRGVVYGRALAWHPVCEAPCTMRVPPDLRYRVAGPSVPASDTFDAGPAGGERRLRVSAGSKGGQLAGALLLVVGIPTSIVGVVVTAESDQTGSRTAGLTTIGAGVAMIALGAILIATNGTSVYDASGRAVATTSPSTSSPLKLGPTGIVF